MDAETKKLLMESIELSKQNNAMLTRLIRNQKWLAIYRVVYWTIIILSSVGAYYFIQPYFSSILSVYSGGMSTNGNGVSFTDMVKNLSDRQQLQNFVESVENKK